MEVNKLLSGNVKYLVIERRNLLKNKSELQKKMKFKLSKEKRDFYRIRICDIDNQKIRNLILFTFTNNCNEKIFIKIIRHYFPDSYYNYSNELFEYCCKKKLLGILYKMCNCNDFIKLMKKNISNNECVKKYKLNVLEYMICYIVDCYIDNNNLEGIIFITKSFNISGIDANIVINFVQYSIKKGFQNIYKYLVEYFKCNIINTIEIPYTTSLLFNEKEISNSIENQFPNIKDKRKYKIRRSFSNETIDNEYSKNELDIANVLADMDNKF